eukprot:scaffold3001_cov145-Pinguiococcus_pyrenoidosus.AAC.3
MRNLFLLGDLVSQCHQVTKDGDRLFTMDATLAGLVGVAEGEVLEYFAMQGKLNVHWGHSVTPELASWMKVKKNTKVPPHDAIMSIRDYATGAELIEGDTITVDASLAGLFGVKEGTKMLMTQVCDRIQGFFEMKTIY